MSKDKNEQMKTPEESYGVYSDGHHIVKVWRNGKDGIAKCNPEDTFNFKKGLELAFSRLKEAESGLVANPEGGNYYHVTTSQGSVSYSSFVPWWLGDKLNAALKNAFVSEEAAKGHADEVIKKYEKVIAYAETL